MLYVGCGGGIVLMIMVFDLVVGGFMKEEVGFGVYGEREEGEVDEY